jgi:CheY-like chemotaxis protein
VVDDARVIGELAGRMLEQAGYAVRIETSPHDVLARGIDEVDVIVSDVIMPGLSGPEMLERLGTALPVVFVSGYADDHLPPELRLGDRRAFVPKPYTAEELRAAVRLVLDGPRDTLWDLAPDAGVPAGG